MLSLTSEIRYLKGVGEARMKLYSKLDIHTVEDLLYHLPRDYMDLSAPCTVESAPLGEKCVIRATVGKKGAEQRIRRGLSLFRVTAFGDTAELRLTFFNTRYAVAALQEGQEYLFYGLVEGGLLAKTMNAPQVFRLTERGLMPVYPQTQGLSARMIHSNVLAALAALPEIPDTLDADTRQDYALPTLDWALRTLHAPDSVEAVAVARRRLAFDELLCLSLGFAAMKNGRAALCVTPMRSVALAPFDAALPFSLTGAQQRAIAECCADLCSDRPMNRLVQGDVGSGKTVVAAACCWFAWKNSAQSVLMAPTELLARQHYATLGGLLGGCGMRLALLTGSTPAAEKRAIKAALAAGEIDLCIGTHALLTGDVAFQNLGLVVTDEQHRFGVSQRAALAQKGGVTNVLVMSATPIPRTLALIIYGDLELSVIDELPAGRQPVETYLIDSAKRARAFAYVRRHLDQGLQGFVVCPLIEGDGAEDSQDLAAAVEYAETLSRQELAGYRVGLLHGRMKPKEKEQTMERFARGELDLLVATTVIEVGIDVPNAVIMVVENAERFGLSQLHQLRGRVGRGSEKSACILISDAKNEETQKRLRVLCRTGDGFRVAEEDLRLRGPGDFFGMRQHGLPRLRLADLAADSCLLAETQRCAQALMSGERLSRLPELSRRVQEMLSRTTL